MKYPTCPRCGSDVTGAMIERPQVKKMIRDIDKKTGKTITSMKRTMGTECSFTSFPCRHVLSSTQFTKIIAALRSGVEKS